MERALHIENLDHALGGRPVLRGVSLEVPRGRFVALLGVNGAGKSTLFNLITRLYDARSGRIAVCGHDLRREPADALRGLGVVFQSRALDANLTVAQNLRYQAALYGIGRREADKRAAALLERFAVLHLMDRPVRALSGGEAQRAEIARAVIHQPALLLCDEATAGLDIRARAALVEEAHRLAREENVGVLWATHLTDEIGPDDDVVALHQGVVIAAGKSSELTGGADLSQWFLERTRAEAGS